MSKVVLEVPTLGLLSSTNLLLRSVDVGHLKSVLRCLVWKEKPDIDYNKLLCQDHLTAATYVINSLLYSPSVVVSFKGDSDNSFVGVLFVSSQKQLQSYFCSTDHLSIAANAKFLQFIRNLAELYPEFVPGIIVLSETMCLIDQSECRILQRAMTDIARARELHGYDTTNEFVVMGTTELASCI